MPDLNKITAWPWIEVNRLFILAKRASVGHHAAFNRNNRTGVQLIDKRSRWRLPSILINTINSAITLKRNWRIFPDITVAMDCGHSSFKIVKNEWFEYHRLSRQSKFAYQQDNQRFLEMLKIYGFCGSRKKVGNDEIQWEISTRAKQMFPQGRHVLSPVLQTKWPFNRSADCQIAAEWTPK